MTSTAKTHTYEVGKQAKLTGLVAQWYGEGPYKIVRIQEISSECTCGDDRASYGLEHAESCGVTVRKNVGHHQLVTLKTKNGKKLISGLWLEPA